MNGHSSDGTKTKRETVEKPETDPPVVGVAVQRHWFVWRDILKTSKEEKIESFEHLWPTKSMYDMLCYVILFHVKKKLNDYHKIVTNETALVCKYIAPTSI